MNTFDVIKQEIQESYPTTRSMGLFNFLVADLKGSYSTMSITHQTERGNFTQSAIILSYKGKNYLKKFGRIENDNPLPWLVKIGFGIVGIISWGALILSLFTRS